MLNFSFYSPTEFVFGKDTELQVGTLLKYYKAKKVLIHYGSGSIKRSGLFDRVVQTLEEEKIEFVELGGVVPNPRDTLVYEGIELCKAEGVDFILAVGGGSAIDSAKAIALGVKYKGDFWDFYDNKAVPKTALNLGVVLTIPAAGSEGSGSTVITKTDGMLKRGLFTRHVRPVFAIVNPELTYTLPRYQTAAGVVDMMSHIFERYLTRTQDVILTDRLAEAALVSIIEAAKVVMKEPTNYEARATICWAGTIAHNGSLGVGRQDDWSTHGLEHELSALYDVTHGAGLAVMFPAFMRYTVDVDVQRYRRLAVKVFGIKDKPKKPMKVALAGIDALEAFFKEIGMPTSFEEVGAKKEDIDILLKKLEINRGSTFGAFKELTLEDARKIYELACK
ncbi:MAG: iron-containing alcohol dehydrogenase [Bacilli bacterium]|nr:iron-containing alcohol dehydrogenase [Bacilli bacterium]MBN2877154.1 iron-containing alcohol dehydrogenase [Bacilli bacterium]